MSLVLKLKDQYNSQGYFKIENFFEKKFINNILKEIEILKSEKSKEIQIYKDGNGHVHRMEQFYQSSEKIILLNKLILKKLKEIFNEEFTIFKDKCNSKPPGETIFAHYDSVFNWLDANGAIRRGWHEYADEFITVLVALDDLTQENGPLELSKWHNEDYEKLLGRIENNGTPYLTDQHESRCEFEPITVKAGSLIFFNSKCPHRSKKNISNVKRRSLYLTYNPIKYGDHYMNYFNDKKNSKNKTSKSLISTGTKTSY